MTEYKAVIVINSNDKVTKSKDEKTKPVQVRSSTYETIRKIAYNNHMKQVDVLDYLVNEGFKMVKLKNEK